mgnify:CR=1 FL=1
MYALSHVDDLVWVKKDPVEVCVLTADQVSKARIVIIDHGGLLWDYFIVRLGQYDNLEYCCRADRWYEPSVSMKF